MEGKIKRAWRWGVVRGLGERVKARSMEGKWYGETGVSSNKGIRNGCDMGIENEGEKEKAGVGWKWGEKSNKLRK